MAHGATQQLDFLKPARPASIWRALGSIVRSGNLKVRDWRDEIHEFGDNTGRPVAIHFRDARIERALFLDPQLAIAEGYMDGEIEFEAGIEVLRPHYARTLAAWRWNFEANREKAASLLSGRFCRMWQFYLAASEVSFRYRDMAVFQIQLAKRIDAAPLTRDYLYVHEGGAQRALGTPV